MTGVLRRRAFAGLPVALVLLVAGLPGHGQAQDCNAGQLMLRCQIGANKQLSVCFQGESATYRFGPPAAPELILTQPVATLDATPWPGIGRSIWEEVVFANADVRYAVWSSVDRLDPAHPKEGGVRVLRGETELASLSCHPGTVDMTGFAVSDGFAAAGFCRDLTRHVWARSCP